MIPQKLDNPNKLILMLIYKIINHKGGIVLIEKIFEFIFCVIIIYWSITMAKAFFYMLKAKWEERKEKSTK